MKIESALIGQAKAGEFLLLPPDYGVVYRKRDLARPQVKATRVGAACSKDMLCAFASCSDGLTFLGFFNGKGANPREKQSILEAHLKQFRIRMAMYESRVAHAAIIGPDPKQRLGAALQHTLKTTLKLSIEVEQLWVPKPKKGVEYAFGYAYRQESVGFIEQAHIKSLDPVQLFKKFPHTLEMHCMRSDVLRRLYDYEPKPLSDGGPPSGSQKHLLTLLLEKLKKAAKGSKTRRSSLKLDTKDMKDWFGDNQPLHRHIKAKAHKGDKDQEKLFAEVEYCRKNNVDFTRKALAGLMLHYPELLARFSPRCLAASKEPFRYYHHAQMVVNQFLDYFLEEKVSGGPLMSNELMIWMMLFHDMDKMLSIETYGNDGEHDATVEAMKAFGALHSGFTFEEVQMAWRMVSMDPFGNFMKGAEALLGSLEKKNKIALKRLSDLPAGHPLRATIKIQKPTEEQKRLDAELIGNCIQEVVDTAALAGVSGAFKNLPAWATRYLQFYQCDFSSYTVDSKYGDNHFCPELNAVKGAERINGPGSFNPPFFGPPDVAGDKDKCLIPMKPGIWGSKRMEFRLIVAEKHVDAFVSAFADASFSSELPKDAFAYMQSLRESLVSERAAMAARAKKTAAVDFRTLFGAKKAPKPADILKLLGGAEAPTENEPVLEQFDNDGVYIRKLVAIAEGKTPRDDLEGSELWKIAEKVVKEQLTPWVLPATLVLRGIPTNLTNAGVELLHCSGLIYSKDTPMAPSTKEHSESAQLSTALNQTIQTRIKQGFGVDKWQGIVRATIEKKGGKTYENRAALVAKLREMEGRRTGKSPDLSTKELLREILLCAQRPMLAVSSFKPCLNYWVHKENGDEALDDGIQKQLRGLYEKTLKGLGKEKWFDRRIVLDALRKKREKRDHTIYDGSDRGLAAGNRYHVADKGPKTKMGSSEADGYDGHTFKTNEVLLLPDAYDRICGVYCNDYSAESQIHALNLLRELHVQCGRQFGLYLYTADDGMRRVEAKTVVGWILARLKTGEKVKGEMPKSAPKAALSGSSTDMSQAEKREVIESMLKAHAVHFPSGTAAKKR